MKLCVPLSEMPQTMQSGASDCVHFFIFSIQIVGVKFALLDPGTLSGRSAAPAGSR